MTEPTILVLIGLCAYFAWRFFAPSFFMNRELARHTRADARRDCERDRLAQALAPLAPKLEPNEIDAAIDRYLDGP